MADTPSDDISEFAKLDFEAWEHSDDEWSPPSNAEWSGLANPHLVNARIAWITMYKTKAELVEVMRGLEDEGIAEELLTSMAESQNFFEGYRQLLCGAEARLLTAACALECEPMALPDA